MQNRTFRLLVSAIVFLLGTIPTYSQVQKLRIGIYDSRLVALAYYNSKDYEKVIANFNSSYSAAEKAGDSAAIRKLLNKGPVMQRIMNDRIFGKGSVNLILDDYKKRMEAIGKVNKVSLIVSKWELPYKMADVETIDLTYQIMAIWNPGEQVIKWAKNGEKEQPIKDAIFDEVK